MNFPRTCTCVLTAAAAAMGTWPAIAAPAAAHRAAAPAVAIHHAASAAVAPKRLPLIVAKVNGKVIGRDELDSDLETYQDGGLAKQILANLILKQLIQDRAQQFGLVPTAAEYEKAYNEANMAAQGRLPQLLAARNLTRAQFEQQFLEPKIELTNLARYGVKVTDADIQEMFDRNKTQWIQPKVVKIYRIHTATLPAAQAVESELAKGASWNDTVKKSSDDAPYYKDHNGYYGAVLPETLPKEVQDAIVNLKAGEYSQPVQVKDEGANPGWTIWRIGEIIPAKQPTLAEHREEIRNMVFQTKSKQDMEVLRDLVKSAKITNLPAGFEQLFAPLMAPPQEMMPPTRPGFQRPGFAPPPAGGPGGPPQGAGGPGGAGPGGIAPPPPPPPALH